MITLNQLTAALRAEYTGLDVECFKWPHNDGGVRIKDSSGKCCIVFIPAGMLSKCEIGRVLEFIRNTYLRVMASEQRIDDLT